MARKLMDWPTDEYPEIPPSQFACPKCGAQIYIEGVDCVVDAGDGTWDAEDVKINCTTAPDIDDPDWDYWWDHHWDMPYVYWLPLSTWVTKWFNENYGFVQTENGVTDGNV